MTSKPKKCNPDIMNVTEVADRLNTRPDTVRAGLITGVLPIGSAVKCERSYAYIIPRKRFEAWINGEDMSYNISAVDNLIKRVEFVIKNKIKEG